MLAAQENQPLRPESEQRHFSAEDAKVKRPVRLPPAVAALLAKDLYVGGMFLLLRSDLEQLPEKWFQASEFHLAGPEERDLIVMGVGQIRGTNAVMFWIFRPRDDGYDVILDGTPAHDLVVDVSRTKGYRDIELISATRVAVSVEHCRFDGDAYPASTLR